ncbi:class I SAM-dependent methyltransferase [Kordia sp. YSTF-M3]|uniref:Class I SAM-dependent methyltransferase n=1 Tax=Kordia aestuariivivens TaxID=2759037 RepID=A0ABR7QA80_9FLAO|nr:class I SAM-dependent methyltransferase [Kordia aestuariivivens]MBC8755383.1 class I SAM-dependent methyltransferase [Kordia aestuariivivens]
MNNLTVKDHSVSGEEFQLVFDEVLKMYKTEPQPSLDKLPSYYESEDYISHTDTQRNLFEKIYHWVRSYMLSKKMTLVLQHTKSDGKKVLDIGCGTGDFLAMAQKYKWEVTGIEPDAQARKIAAEKTTTEIHTNDWLAEIPDHSFDAITMWHVLEHVPNLEEQIATLKRIIKPNGTIFIAVPNFNSHDASHYKEFWAAYDVPRHLWHFSQNAIKGLFQKENLKVVKVLPMKFDAYYVSLLSEKHKTGKMNPVKGFYRGFVSNFKAITTSEYSSLIYVIKND